ncbi:hypothetical protein FM103_16940 [Corynebacterium xerosis]|nr:hypothetical protein FM103_16940 [Corynebacterium xerosis]
MVTVGAGPSPGRGPDHFVGGPCSLATLRTCPSRRRVPVRARACDRPPRASPRCARPERSWRP